MIFIFFFVNILHLAIDYLKSFTDEASWWSFLVHNPTFGVSTRVWLTFSPNCLFREKPLSFANFFRQLSFLDQLSPVLDIFCPKESLRISGRSSARFCDQVFMHEYLNCVAWPVFFQWSVVLSSRYKVSCSVLPGWEPRTKEKMGANNRMLRDMLKTWYSIFSINPFNLGRSC
jgi:hypothetical protein